MRRRPDTNDTQAMLDTLQRLPLSDRRLLLELAFKLDIAHGGLHTSPLTGQTPDLRPHVDPWLSYLLIEGKSPRTLHTYGLYVRLLLRRFPAPDDRDITAYLTDRLAAGARQPTIATTIFAFRSFFAYLTRVGILARDPARHLHAPPPPQRERTAPKPADVARLLTAQPTNVRDRALILLLADCGLRITEALTLTPQAVDLSGSQVTVIGKGNKQRTVPASPTTIHALRVHMHTFPPGSPWLFPGRPKTKHLHPHNAAARFQDLCDRAGVPRFTPHQLRHFCATAMLNDGANLKVVSELLGHAHASTTANIYWHVLGADERRLEHQRHNPLREVIGGLK